ncbi:sulfatase-like hydrolase/transferase [Acidobacteria bacterium AH-259-O06]|nr:sulfatase-like hydrolase/transferase [Acidobacteria bacterium AH-259-O06]
MRNSEVLEEDADLDTLTQKYTSEAIKYIFEHKDRPFFLYLAHNMPHVPLGASEKFKGQSKRGLYGDAVEELDGEHADIVVRLMQLAEQAREDLGDYNRIGKRARFFDDAPPRPDIDDWKKEQKQER